MSEKSINISITAGTIFKSLLIIAVVAVLFYLRDLVLVVLTAIVIASGIEPAAKWLMKRKIPRVLSVLCIYLSVVAIVAVIVVFLVPQLLVDLVDLLNRLPEYVQTVQVWNPLENFSSIGNIVSVKDIVNNASTSLLGVTSGTFNLVPFIFGGFFNLILIIVFSFYLAVQEDGVSNFLRVITPVHHEKYVIDLWRRTQTKIGLWLQGQILLGVIIGVMVFLGLSILGVPNALFLSIVAAVFELIPIFGPILATVPAVAVGISNGGLATGILIIGFYIIIQQFENHLIYPLVVKKIIGVPALLVILALIIGGRLGGFLGLILSVPIAAALMEFYTDMEKSKARAIEKMSQPMVE